MQSPRAGQPEKSVDEGSNKDIFHSAHFCICYTYITTGPFFHELLHLTEQELQVTHFMWETPHFTLSSLKALSRPVAKRAQGLPLILGWAAHTTNHDYPSSLWRKPFPKPPTGPSKASRDQESPSPDTHARERANSALSQPKTGKLL